MSEALVVFVAVLLATVSTVYFIYVHAVSAQQGEIRQGLLRTANIIAARIDPDLHATFAANTSGDDPRYLELQQQLRQMQHADPGIAFVWTATRREGAMRYVIPPDMHEGAVDSAESASTPTLWHPRADLDRAFDSATTVVSEQPHRIPEAHRSKALGELAEHAFITAFVPLRDGPGEVAAVLGVDLDASNYFRRLAPIQQATQWASMTAVFIAVMAALAVWWLRRHIARINRRRWELYQAMQAQIELQKSSTDGIDTAPLSAPRAR